MNIKILDSWLREFLKTKATTSKVAEILSLTSVSVERLEKYGKNYVYDIEITTNRPDLMSIVGLAREAAAALSQSGIEADFQPPNFKNLQGVPLKNLPVKIENDPKLVNRIMAIIMEVNLKESPAFIKDRLEASGIRSLNNVIDVTNYVMRETGHPTHVFDYDRLTTKTLIIRESKKGERIKTLDDKEHILQGGDIVADNGEGEIIDLLGVMGTENSVVTNKTKRILYFLDNNDPHRIRKTSMSLGIRSEAAVLNEKGVDPEIGYDAILKGIELYKQIANAKILSNIIDIYPNKNENRQIALSEEKINSVIGVEIPRNIIHNVLVKLGFKVKNQVQQFIVSVPSWRVNDIEIEEDLIEEIARIYGYHKLPNIIPPLSNIPPFNLSENPLYWEERVKNALKYWGFTEVYTYSLVSEDLLEGPVEEALKLANPLINEMAYLRKTLVPSLLKVIRENENREVIKIFELANIYIPETNDLPKEIMTLGSVIKKENVSFYEIKGLVEQIFNDLGIKDFEFKQTEVGGIGADVYINKDYVGCIEVLEKNIADFELNFDLIIKHVSLKKNYIPISKYPPIIEDVRLKIDPRISFKEIVELIKKQSKLISQVNLLDVYKDKKTFRIIYQDMEKNLTNEDVSKIREKVYKILEEELKAKIV